MLKGSVGLIALGSLLLSGTAFAQEKIKVGVTATLEGTYTVLGEDGIRGFQTALNVLGKKVGDKELEFVIASTDATPDSAVRAVRKLIEQDKVQILLSPLSGDEGIAVKNFAKTHPELAFVNAASGAQETTYVDPAPNFFRYNMDGAQWQVGLGKYAYETKGYRKIATVGEDYSFIYTQVFGLVLEEGMGLGRPFDIGRPLFRERVIELIRAENAERLGTVLRGFYLPVRWGGVLEVAAVATSAGLLAAAVWGSL